MNNKQEKGDSGLGDKEPSLEELIANDVEEAILPGWQRVLSPEQEQAIAEIISISRSGIYPEYINDVDRTINPPFFLSMITETRVYDLVVEDGGMYLVPRVEATKIVKKLKYQDPHEFYTQALGINEPALKHSEAVVDLINEACKLFNIKLGDYRGY